ncbi:hypothetical+protein [Methylocapsa aurea]
MRYDDRMTTKSDQAPAFSVAVVDSGSSGDFPVLPGINLSNEGAIDDVSDRCGHGDAVASTILGIAPAVGIVPVKVTDRRGVLRDRDVLTTALEWILDHHARLAIGVVSIALGDQSNLASDAELRGSALQRRIAALRAAGVLTVAPAGNWRRLHQGRGEGMVWPGILREVVSVGEARRGPEGLRLSPASQRLRATPEGVCATTIFTEAAPPGETSGAAAAIAGVLARLAAADRSGGAEAALTALLRIRRVALDEEGIAWPAILAEDVAAGSTPAALRLRPEPGSTP